MRLQFVYFYAQWKRQRRFSVAFKEILNRKNHYHLIDLKAMTIFREEDNFDVKEVLKILHECQVQIMEF